MASLVDRRKEPTRSPLADVLAVLDGGAPALDDGDGAAAPEAAAAAPAPRGSGSPIRWKEREDPEALRAVADRELAARDPAAAVALLERAVALDPGFADAWFNLGVAREAAGDVGGAEAALRRAARLEPLAWDARLNLAGVLQRAGAAVGAVEAEVDAAFRLDGDLRRRSGTRKARFRPGALSFEVDGDHRDALLALRGVYGADSATAALAAAAACDARSREAAAALPAHASGPRWHDLRLALSDDALDARAGAGRERELPKGADLGRVPLVSADFWTSDHVLERSRRVPACSGTHTHSTLASKRRRVAPVPRRRSTRASPRSSWASPCPRRSCGAASAPAPS